MGSVRILSCLFLISLSISAVCMNNVKKDLVKGRQILVFGGNGFLGAGTVEHFIQNEDNVTIVNRGNWYWDSFTSIKPHVQHISCDRKNGIDSCEELVALIIGVDKFDAVIDFSAYDEQESKDAGALLKDKVSLYVMISTDSIYDVCQKDHEGRTKETDDQRPGDVEEVARLKVFHGYGHKKLKAEEAIIKQRTDDGFPYVILRLPDVIGPRDSTHRWWMYQLWVKLESNLPFKPVTIPHFLADYHMSFVYSADVSKLIFELLLMSDAIHDNVFNIAYEETYTLEELIRAQQMGLNIEEVDITEESNHTQSLYMYPSVRTGPIDVSKAKEMLDWTPTPFAEAVDDTVKFYEDAMTGDTFDTQRDEVIQGMTHRLYDDHKIEFYEAVENTYGISLFHFKPRDEL